MKLRFQVNQAEAFRRGIDCPKSIVSVEVNPAEVESSLREMIAERLSGIDVCQGIMRIGKVEPYVMMSGPQFIITNGPEWDDLVAAIRADVERIKKENTITDYEPTFGDKSGKKGGRK